MVVVPSGPSIQPSPVQATQARAFGSTPVQDFTGQQLQQAGAAATSLGVQVGRLIQENQEREDATRARELLTPAEEADLKDTLGFQGMVGKEATDSYQGVLNTYDERTKTLLRAADNDRQRNAISERRAVDRERMIGRTMPHYLNQVRAREIGAVAASRQGKEDSAVGYYQDPQGNAKVSAANRELVNQALADRIAEERKKGNDTPEQLNLAMLDTTTRIHSGRINQMLADGRLEEAEAYLAENRDAEIDPVVATSLQGDVQSAIGRAARVSAKGSAEEVGLRLAVGFSQQGLTLAGSKAVLDRLLLDPDNPIDAATYEAAWQKAKDFHSTKETERKEIDNETVNGLRDEFLKNEKLDWNALPVALRDDLDERGLRYRVIDAHRDVSAKRLADRLADDPTSKLLAREVRNVDTVRRILEYLRERESGAMTDVGIGGEADAGTRAKLDRVKARIEEMEQLEEILVRRASGVGSAFAKSAILQPPDTITIPTIFESLFGGQVTIPTSGAQPVSTPPPSPTTGKTPPQPRLTPDKVDSYIKGIGKKIFPTLGSDR